MPEIGEEIAGAYLEVIEECSAVVFNVRYGGQHEIDVLGIHFPKQLLFACEVATHLNGLNYARAGKSDAEVIREKIEANHGRVLRVFPEYEVIHQFWSPRVGLTNVEALQQLQTSLHDGQPSITVQLIINEEYAKRIAELRKQAKRTKEDKGNNAFRMLQILTNLKT